MEDRLVIKLDLDSNSIEESLDELHDQTDKIFSENLDEFNGSVIELNDSIVRLTDSVAQANYASEQFRQNLVQTNEEIERSTRETISFSDVLFKVSDAIVYAYNNIDNLIDFVKSLPETINLAISQIVHFSESVIYVIQLLNLDNHAIFAKLVQGLTSLNDFLIRFDQTLEKNIEKLIFLLSLKVKIDSFFESFKTAISNVTKSTLLGISALTAYNVYITKDFVQGISITSKMLNEFIGKISVWTSKVGSFFKNLSESPGDYFRAIRNSIFGVVNTLKQDIELFSKALFSNNNTLFSILEFIGTFSSKITLLSGVLGLTGNKLVLFFAGFTGFLGVLTGFLGWQFIKLIYKIGDVFSAVGHKLTEFFQESYHHFLEFRKETLAFTETINAFNRDFSNSVGGLDEWKNKISEVSKELNFSQSELRRSATEIIAVGSRLGFSKEQMQQLLDVVAAYARLTGKDLFQTTVNFTSALQGQSQAVLAYGVKLTEASNTQFALKSGMEESFISMSEGEKVQVRFNNLISQYTTVAGVAKALANDWYQQNNKLKVTLENINNEIGAGASIIEDFNIASGILNKTLGLLPNWLFTSYGLFGALTGRLTSFFGYIVKSSFNMFLLYRAFLLIDTFLKTKTFENFANWTLPIFNKNLIEILKSLGATEVKIKGAPELFKTLGEVFNKNRHSIFGFLVGVTDASKQTSILGIIMAKFAQMSSRAFLVLQFGLGVLSPFIVKAALLYAAIYAVIKVFDAIDEKTQLFTLLGESFKNLFDTIIVAINESSSVFGPVLDGIKTAFSTTFGFIVFVVASNLGLILDIVSKTAGIFSDKVAAPLRQASQNLNDLSKNLMAANFDFSELNNRAIASSEAMNKFKFDKLEQLSELLKTLKEETTSSLGKIAKEQEERLDLINQALKGEVISVEKAEQAKLDIRRIATQKTQEILNGLFNKNSQEDYLKLTEDYNKRQSILNEALNRGLITRKYYNELTLQNQEMFNAEMDKILKSNTETQMSEQQKIMELYGLTAEAAEKAISIQQRINEALVNSTTGTIERLGATLVKGGEAWEDFGGFILNILGDLAIQVGTIIMGMGTAVNSLAASLASFNGFAAIAAGAALIALGGALKALASTMGGDNKRTDVGVTPLPSVSTPGGGVGIYPNPAFGPRAEAERQNINPNVTINIEGNLYSTEETGRNLIDLISKEFDKSGAQIRRRRFA